MTTDAMNHDDEDPSDRTVMTPSDDEERRRHRRWPIDCGVHEIDPKWRMLHATSLSAGGVFCSATVPHQIGDQLTVQLDMGWGRPIVTRATVVHMETLDADFGIGLEFSEAQPQLDVALSRLSAGTIAIG